MGNASGTGADGTGRGQPSIGTDRSSGIARGGSKGADFGNNMRGGFSGGAGGTPGSSMGGISGNERDLGRNASMAESRGASISRGSMSAPSRSAPAARPAAPPVARPVAAPPPVRSVPSVAKLGMHNALSPTAMTTATNASMAMVDDPSLASVPSTVSTASPPTRSPIGYSGAARQVGSAAAAKSQANSEAVHGAVKSSLGTPSSATPSRASPASRGGIADAARSVGARSTGVPGVSSGASPSSRSPAGYADAARSVGLRSSLEGSPSSSFGKGFQSGQMAGSAQNRSASPPTRSPIGYSGAARMVGARNVASLAEIARNSQLSNLSDAEISGLIGNITSGAPNTLNQADPLGNFATRVEANPNSQSMQDALSRSMSVGLLSGGIPSGVASATPAPKSIQDRLSTATMGVPSIGQTPSNAPPQGSIDVQNAYKDFLKGGYFPEDEPSPDTYGFYSSPDETNAYPSIVSPQADDAITTILSTIANPPSGLTAFANAAYGNKEAQRVARSDRGGGRDRDNSKTRQSTVKKIAEALKKETRKSGWTPYTGPTRFANWTPIQKALMG